MNEMKILHIQMMTHKLGCFLCKEGLICPVEVWLKRYIEDIKDD